jgi:hypothetical protein
MNNSAARRQPADLQRQPRACLRRLRPSREPETLEPPCQSQKPRTGSRRGAEGEEHVRHTIAARFGCRGRARVRSANVSLNRRCCPTTRRFYRHDDYHRGLELRHGIPRQNQPGWSIRQTSYVADQDATMRFAPVAFIRGHHHNGLELRHELPRQYQPGWGIQQTSYVSDQDAAMRFAPAARATPVPGAGADRRAGVHEGLCR